MSSNVFCFIFKHFNGRAVFCKICSTSLFFERNASGSIQAPSYPDLNIAFRRGNVSGLTFQRRFVSLHEGSFVVRRYMMCWIYWSMLVTWRMKDAYRYSALINECLCLDINLIPAPCFSRSFNRSSFLLFFFFSLFLGLYFPSSFSSFAHSSSGSWRLSTCMWKNGAWVSPSHPPWPNLVGNECRRCSTSLWLKHMNRSMAAGCCVCGCVWEREKWG